VNTDDLRPVKYTTLRGAFEGWFHGWDPYMIAIIEVPNGDVVAVPVGGDNEMVFMDRAQEAEQAKIEKEMKAANDKAEFEAQKEKAAEK
jgi:hypothetical protein